MKTERARQERKRSGSVETSGTGGQHRLGDDREKHRGIPRKARLNGEVASQGETSGPKGRMAGQINMRKEPSTSISKAHRVTKKNLFR